MNKSVGIWCKRFLKKNEEQNQMYLDTLHIPDFRRWVTYYNSLLKNILVCFIHNRFGIGRNYFKKQSGFIVIHFRII